MITFEIFFILAQSCVCNLSMLMLRTLLHSFVVVLVLMLASSENQALGPVLDVEWTICMLD